MNMSEERKPPDICPSWYRSITLKKPPAHTPKVYYDSDEVTRVMSKDIVNELRKQCIKEDELQDLTLDLEDD